MAETAALSYLKTLLNTSNKRTKWLVHPGWWPHFCLKTFVFFFSQKLVPFLQFEIFIRFSNGAI